MLMILRARQTLAFAIVIVAAFLLAGCGGAPTVGWSGARVVSDTIYFGSVTGGENPSEDRPRRGEPPGPDRRELT